MPTLKEPNATVADGRLNYFENVEDYAWGSTLFRAGITPTVIKMDGVRHWGVCTEDCSQCIENCPVSDSPCVSGFAPAQPAGERANCVFEGGLPLFNAPRGFWNRTRLARLELHTCSL